MIKKRAKLINEARRLREENSFDLKALEESLVAFQNEDEEKAQRKVYSVFFLLGLFDSRVNEMHCLEAWAPSGTGSLQTVLERTSGGRETQRKRTGQNNWGGHRAAVPAQTKSVESAKVVAKEHAWKGDGRTKAADRRQRYFTWSYFLSDTFSYLTLFLISHDLTDSSPKEQGASDWDWKKQNRTKSTNWVSQAARAVGVGKISWKNTKIWRGSDRSNDYNDRQKAIVIS